MPEPNTPRDAMQVAERLAGALDERGQEYALGGAIALAYWAQPRGTLDVDLTLFLPKDKPSEVIWILQDIGCEVNVSEAILSLREHTFCRGELDGYRVDVFLPMAPFYDQARVRRRRVVLGQRTASVWDAETLTVFKMMFFRRKDLADVEAILHEQKAAFDRAWVREQLVELYGVRDPRITQWDELCQENAP
jgi:hypothetical protein